MTYTLDWQAYTKLARQTVAEGAVLLQNDGVLPLQPATTVAVFGRNQFNYYKSGTGSGGMVNVTNVVSPLDMLREDVTLNTDVLKAYENWLEDHPFDQGEGWAAEPWSQEEMPLDATLVQQAALDSDVALIMIGRTAGEDRDNTADPGSYFLTETEQEMLRLVTTHFKQTVVVLNVGNIIDMRWVEETAPSAVLYAWQGGMEGGTGLSDLLLGRISPSGKLPDTIVRSLDDYPSTPHFGHADHALYQEDLYVGYRYFETFAPETVLYPFGYGLSYTSFNITTDVTMSADAWTVTATVTNTGQTSGKEVI
ncbi:glycoside hydrolase family 3 C-terminal domain-containing protein [Exiguobacterium sp. s130]|uniref:glycoside hydrolase family 3 protein n=2 Tax=unclassified Exiguobacterium TaxID=2644629 RepID=UPI00333DC25B